MLVLYRFLIVSIAELLMWFQLVLKLPEVAYHLEKEFLQVLR